MLNFPASDSPGHAALRRAQISIEGLAVEHSTSGISVTSPGGEGDVEVKDCHFKGVWNRSSVGQRLPTTENQCSNGWSPCIVVGNVASALVTGCIFEDFDVAFQPSGTIGRARFLGNTLTGGNGNVVFLTASHDWLLSNNIFTRDWAPRYFTCGTTDIMIGGADSKGSISHNEIGWRGEHPAAPDGEHPPQCTRAHPTPQPPAAASARPPARAPGGAAPHAPHWPRCARTRRLRDRLRGRVDWCERDG